MRGLQKAVFCWLMLQDMSLPEPYQTASGVVGLLSIVLSVLKLASILGWQENLKLAYVLAEVGVGKALNAPKPPDVAHS